MNLKSFIPASLHAELETVFHECKEHYFYFDPNDLLHQMFAMQIMLARQLAKPKELVEELERDDAVLLDILLLVGVEVPIEVVEQWTDQQYERAEMWASASALAASDNDVLVPKMPQFLDKYLIPF